MQNDPYNVILRRERESHFLTQEKLAEVIGTDARLIRRWESGIGFPHYKYRQKLCEFYGKSAYDLGFSIEPDNTRAEPSVKTINYRRMEGSAPPTCSKSIQQREHTVRNIYERLTHPDITALVITGIGGVGKSTLAALIMKYAQKQYLAGNGPFSVEPLWLSIDSATTMADLVGTLYETLEKPLPDLDHLSPQNQALVLFQTLETIDQPRLVILDQFENLLDWQTGLAYEDRGGIGEWLDIINSRPCRSRILLTSRSWPQGTRRYPPSYMEEYHDQGLETEEGIELLQKQGVEATQSELRTAVTYCKGHAFALALLASFLREHKLSLHKLFKDPMYTRLWMGNIAKNFLHAIYTRQLQEGQRKVLVAFSVYRKPIRPDALLPILDLFKVPPTQIESDLSVLLAQSLLQADSEGHYQLHSIVGRYLQDHFVENDHRANHEMKRGAHSKAAHFYLQQAATSLPARESRHRIPDVRDLIEAVWQLCQAEQWREAYDLVQQEGIFSDLMRWGGSATLLGLFKHLLPFDKWHPENAVKAHIYNELSEIYNNLWQNEQALAYCDQALSICRKEGDFDEESRALANFGDIYSGLGENKLALDYCEQALYMLRKRGDRDGEGKVLGNLGWIYWVTGQKQRAMECYEQALHIHRGVGNRLGEGIALNGLGLVHSTLGQSELAIDFHQQSLSIRRETGDLAGESRTLNNLGLMYAQLGQHKLALNYYQQALSISRRIGERAGEGRQLNNIGQVYASLGQNKRALEYYQQALSICRRIGDREGEEWVLTNVGKVYHALRQSVQALNYFQEALGISRQVGDREGEASILHRMGLLYFEQKEYDPALRYLLLARKHFEEVQGLGREGVQSCIDTLRKEFGEEQFALLVDQIEPMSFQFIA
ncbi:MAG: tetratricopeptide repeat protein [Ktedonobacteraceae bacterium]